MAAVRTTQFASRELTVASTPATLYTVPSGKRALVKYVSFISAATVPGVMGIWVATGGGVTTSFLFRQVGATAILYREAGIYGVANEGDLLQAFVQSVTGGTSYVHCGGVLFDV